MSLLKGQLIAPAFLLLFASGEIVRAGLMPSDLHLVQARTWVAEQRDAVAIPESESSRTTEDTENLWLSGEVVSQVSFIQSSEDKILVGIPAPPDSATLVLVALSSLGIWKIGSSAKKLTYARIPEWFAADAPRQIGFTQLVEPAMLEGRLVFSQPFAASERVTNCGQQASLYSNRLDGDNHAKIRRKSSKISPRAPPFFVGIT